MTKKYLVPKFKAKLVRDGASVRVSCADDAAEMLRVICCERGDREVFAVLYLDACLNVIGVEVVGVGAGSACLVEASTVFRGAVLAGAAGIIIGHNHPSRSVVPSTADVEITKLLVAAGKVLGIPVHDHVIVTDDGKSVSFHDHGMIGGAS